MKVPCSVLLACVFLGGYLSAGQAQVTYHVHFDTSALPASPLFLNVTLSDGSVVDFGVPDGNNQVALTNLDLGGGALGDALPNIGNVSGDLFGAAVTLTDSDPDGVADFAQAFTPGMALDFDLSMTTNPDAGAMPDTLLLRMLDDSENPIATLDPSGENALVSIRVGSVPQIQSYDGAPGSAFVLPAPQVTPEPSAWTCLALMLAAAPLARRHVRRGPGRCEQNL